MTSRDFCYWLQGFFELDAAPVATGLNIQQLEKVRRHLAMVFEHEIDPSMPNPKLDEIHTQGIVNITGQAKTGSVTSPFGPKFRC